MSASRLRPRHVLQPGIYFLKFSPFSWKHPKALWVSNHHTKKNHKQSLTEISGVVNALACYRSHDLSQPIPSGACVRITQVSLVIFFAFATASPVCLLGARLSFCQMCRITLLESCKIAECEGLCSHVPALYHESYLVGTVVSVTIGCIIYVCSHFSAIVARESQ